MGFVGKIFKTIFSPSIPSVSSVNVNNGNTVTGRDILTSTSSAEPDSAVMGSERDLKRKNQGISSLLVPSESLYHGGGQ